MQKKKKKKREIFKNWTVSLLAVLTYVQYVMFQREKCHFNIGHG